MIPVAAKEPFVIGVQAGSIVAANSRTPPLAAVAARGHEAPSAARVQVAKDSGYALIFRRDGAIWSGWLGLESQARGRAREGRGLGWSGGEAQLGVESPRAGADLRRQAGREQSLRNPGGPREDGINPGGDDGDATVPKGGPAATRSRPTSPACPTVAG